MTLPLTFKRLGKLGRLGNCLFQLASTVGAARKLDRPIALDPTFPYRPFLSMPDDWFSDGWMHAEDAPRYFAGPPNRWTPYGQRPENFAHAADEIRAAFAPSPRAQAVLDALPVPGPDDVAVHVRRTDYERFPDHLPMLPVGYYEACAGWIRPHTNDPQFHVYGDDPEWIESALPDGWVWHRWGADTPDDLTDWADLFQMARYRQIVIANSSFSWWSAFLGGPESAVFAPSPWFGPAIDVPSPVLPEWIEVPCDYL